jgi:hypothetical protein
MKSLLQYLYIPECFSPWRKAHSPERGNFYERIALLGIAVAVSKEDPLLGVGDDAEYLIYKQRRCSKSDLWYTFFVDCR